MASVKSALKSSKIARKALEIRSSIRSSPKLPKYVVIKHGDWYVRRGFPTGERNAKDRPVYVQVVRKVEPQTEEQAKVVSDSIEAMYRAAKTRTVHTVSEAVNEFLSAKKLSVATSTVEYYHWMSQHINFGHLDLADVTPRTVQQFYSKLQVSPKMLRKIHIFLSMVFKQAVRWELMKRNPCEGAILPRANRPVIEILNKTEAQRFMKVCLDKYPVLAFALETWMRPGEYLALQWKNVDLRNRSVKVERTVVFPDGGGHYFKLPKTNSGRRTIEITETLCKRLRKIKRKGELVFPNREGKPIRPDNLRTRDMEEACTLAKIKKHSIYALRHTGITLALEAGADIKAVSERAGHASIQITLDTYAHVMPSMRSKITDQMEVLYQ